MEEPIEAASQRALATGLASVSEMIELEYERHSYSAVEG